MNIFASLWIVVAGTSLPPRCLGFTPAAPQLVGRNLGAASSLSFPVHAWTRTKGPPTLSSPLATTRRTTNLAAVVLQHDDSLSSLLTALDTFDGSSIVDPVVVSSTFWSSLTTKFVSLLIGQLIATLVFTIVISVAASQLSGVLDRVSKGVVERMLGPPPPTLRVPPPPSAQQGASSSSSSTSLPTMDLQKLALCLAIDVLGTSSELLPIVGEFTDVLYAPLAATLLRNLYGSNVVFVLEFAEEILPFTDVIPLATICWVVDTLAPTSGLAQLLQLGDFREGAGTTTKSSNNVVIDTTTTTSRLLESDKKRDEGSFR